MCDISHIFITKLYELQKERNLSQADLAALIHVRRETIGNLENGRYNPSLKLAMDIAKIFEMSFWGNISAFADTSNCEVSLKSRASRDMQVAALQTSPICRFIPAYAGLLSAESECEHTKFMPPKTPLDSFYTLDF